MSSQRTLVLLKPDAVLKGVDGEIPKRYTDAGLEIIDTKYFRMNEEMVFKFYEGHMGKFYSAGLILAMTSGVMVAMLLQGEDAIERVRKLNGATDPSKAEPGTIRHDFRSAGGPFNTVHGSDSPEAAEREIGVVFGYKLID